MFGYGWLAWCMRISVKRARVAGYTTGHNWLATAATCAASCTRALPQNATCAVCSPVLLMLGILEEFSFDELCLVMLAGLVHGDF